MHGRHANAIKPQLAATLAEQKQSRRSGQNLVASNACNAGEGGSNKQTKCGCSSYRCSLSHLLLLFSFFVVVDVAYLRHYAPNPPPAPPTCCCRRTHSFQYTLRAEITFFYEHPVKVRQAGMLEDSWMYHKICYSLFFILPLTCLILFNTGYLLVYLHTSHSPIYLSLFYHTLCGAFLSLFTAGYLLVDPPYTLYFFALQIEKLVYDLANFCYVHWKANQKLLHAFRLRNYQPEKIIMANPWEGAVVGGERGVLLPQLPTVCALIKKRLPPWVVRVLRVW